MNWLKIKIIYILSICVIMSCNKTTNDFEYLESRDTGIDFENTLTLTEDYNPYIFKNFFNGGGVGIGDFNNDGLSDIYFCGNQVDNKLYINKGNLKFEDITIKAGVECREVWSSGVSIADVNGDGWQDIYVCKSGKPGVKGRKNSLYINNHDLTFTDIADSVGVSDFGLSTHASFFDYDNDGDLDMYLLNNSLKPVGYYDLLPDQREIRDSLSGNKIYENKLIPKGIMEFEDVTNLTGIFSSEIGFGLGIGVSDFNKDGYVDLYIANDFFEKDYLYINNKNKTFSEVIESSTSEISMGAMGVDCADINNDKWSDITVTEMLPIGLERQKSKTQFESWNKYVANKRGGYFQQFSRNSLQLFVGLNHNNYPVYSEASRKLGIAQSEWSWSALVNDFDNDGWKDAYITNGIRKDLLDQDYISYYNDATVMQKMIKQSKTPILDILSKIPEKPLENLMLKNNRDRFINVNQDWGLDKVSYSNGGAYADLDNDGDLDLVVNNIDDKAFVIKNNSREKYKTNFVNIELEGVKNNTFSLGAKVTVYTKDNISYQELYPMRGYQSTCDHRLHFGLGQSNKIDSVVIVWPLGEKIVMNDVELNKFHKIKYQNSTDLYLNQDFAYPMSKNYKWSNIILCKDNVYNEFDNERLLLYMISNESNDVEVGDLDGNGVDEIIIGSSKGNPTQIWEVGNSGPKRKIYNEWLLDSMAEDTDLAISDFNNDGLLDVYITSGGMEYSSDNLNLMDRLYINLGKGSWKKQKLPKCVQSSNSTIAVNDYDKDGDLDVFLGERVKPFAYGISCSGHILKNDGKANFVEDIDAKNVMSNLSFVTDAIWADIDNDSDDDLIVVGHFQEIKVFENIKGKFKDETLKYGLQNTSGLWNTIYPVDIEKDGDVDFVVGNVGNNLIFEINESNPLTLWINDFDMNGSVDPIHCLAIGAKEYPIHQKDEIVSQLPILKKKILKYSDYSKMSMDELFDKSILEKSIVRKANVSKHLFLENDKGSFVKHELPKEVNSTSIFSIYGADIDSDGNTEVILGGNHFSWKPYLGIQGAGKIYVMNWNNKKFQINKSPILEAGELRSINSITVNNKEIFLFAFNNEMLQFYE